MTTQARLTLGGGLVAFAFVVFALAPSTPAYAQIRMASQVISQDKPSLANPILGLSILRFQELL